MASANGNEKNNDNFGSNKSEVDTRAAARMPVDLRIGKDLLMVTRRLRLFHMEWLGVCVVEIDGGIARDRTEAEDSKDGDFDEHIYYGAQQKGGFGGLL